MSAYYQLLPRTLKVGVSTLLSRLLGLLRNIVTAQAFGTSLAMDMFNIAFTIPNLFRRLFGEGALNAAFIPVFTRESTDPNTDERRLFHTVMTALAVVLGGIAALGWVLCAIVLLFGNFPENPDPRLFWNVRLFWILLAIMLPYLPLICMTALQGAALNVRGHFFTPAIAPALLNVCWLIAVILFAKPYGVTAISVGVLISGVLQFGMQVPMLWKHGLRLRVLWDLRHPGLRRVAQLMLPVSIGIGVYQVNVLLDRIIAQTCIRGEGANSALFYGNNLMQFPLGVLGLALATAVFPAYAFHAGKGDNENMIRTVNLVIRATLFMSLPCVAVMVALNEPIVRVLFERGKFTAESTSRTAAVLLYYGLGLWAFSMVHVVARAFYAFQDMRTPVRLATAVVVVNLGLNLIFVWPMREAGLALASSIAISVHAVILLMLLRKNMGRLGGHGIVIAAVKCCVASGLCGLAGWGTWSWMAAQEMPRIPKMPPDTLPLALSLTAAAASFLLAARGLRIQEVNILSRLIFKKRPL